MWILVRVTAVVVERGAPKHRTVVHHAQVDVINGLGMAEAAGAMRDAEIARVDELDEFVRLVIEQDARVVWVRGALPEDIVFGDDVRLLLGEAGSGIAAVTVGATEDDVRRLVHLFNAGVALQATAAFGVRFSKCLVDAIARGALCGGGG